MTLVDDVIGVEEVFEVVGVDDVLDVDEVPELDEVDDVDDVVDVADVVDVPALVDDVVSDVEEVTLLVCSALSEEDFFFFDGAAKWQDESNSPAKGRTILNNERLDIIGTLMPNYLNTNRLK